LLVLRLPARFPLRFIIALLLGVLHSLSFLDDDVWPLQIITLAALIAQGSHHPRGLSPWTEARAGFAFGLGWFLAGTHWIYVSLHNYGDMAAPLAAAATLLLCAYMSLYPALATGLRALIDSRLHLGPARSALLVFPPLWMASEWLRGSVFTGYPWLASGYAHIGSPLAGYAPIVGVYGIALLAAACAGAIALLGARQSARAATLVLIGIVLTGSLLRQVEWASPAGKPVSVRLLQGNIPQELKFVEGRLAQTLQTYVELIEKKPAQLIVLPETALPRFLHQMPEDLLQRLAAFSSNTGSSIAFGVPVYEKDGGYFNSVVAYTPDGAPAQRYDKTHLVPFGEFVPWGFRWFVDLMHIPLGDFSRGKTDAQPMTLAGLRVAFNVCYEDLFGAEIARQASVANVLINVSNVAWFGDSLALPQHLQASRMRALETARPMLRATNTGKTAAIDEHGRVLAELPTYSTASLDLSIQGMSGDTPYTRWRDGAILLAGALLLAAAVAGKRSGRKNHPAQRDNRGF
jgi:apolipoprotein N-acyltransferase